MNDSNKMTHFDQRGAARMVEVGDKAVSARRAVAEGWIRMRAETAEMIRAGTSKKGDVLAIARVAGIMAAKRTAELVPLCHPIMLTGVHIDFDVEYDAVHCIATAATCERTGVEMEALCATQVALLTIYDMCKSVDRAMSIADVRLVHKSGGKSGEWNRGTDNGGE